jgi:hypothetical protein
VVKGKGKRNSSARKCAIIRRVVIFRSRSILIGSRGKATSWCCTREYKGTRTGGHTAGEHDHSETVYTPLSKSLESETESCD